MLKRFCITLLAVISLAVVGLNGQPQPANAQKIHQAIPAKYWGNWQYKQTKVTIENHLVKGPNFSWSGKKLGVRISKGFVSVFQTYKGKPASQSYMLVRKTKHHKAVLKANFDGNSEWYHRTSIF